MIFPVQDKKTLKLLFIPTTAHIPALPNFKNNPIFIVPQSELTQAYIVDTGIKVEKK